MLILPLSVELAYAQESASVPVTIILEGPENTTSASETAPPKLLIDFDPPSLEVQLGDHNRVFWVNFRPEPVGRVDVSIDVSSGPSPTADLSNFTATTEQGDGSSLLITPYNWNRRTVSNRVTVDAETDAELGDYIVKVAASGTGVTDTKEVTVKVVDWVTHEPARDILVEKGGSGTWGTGWGTGSGGFPQTGATYTLELLEPVPEYLSFSPDPPELIFPYGSNHDPKYIQVYATGQAVVGARHRFRLTHTRDRDGYPDIEDEGYIIITGPPCTFGITETSDLDFGTWRTSGDDEERWSVKVDEVDGSIGEVTNVTQVIGSSVVSVGKAKLVYTNCRGYNDCGIQVDPLTTLTGNNRRGTVNFDKTFTMVRREGDPDDESRTFHFGGRISGRISETPANSYTGTLTVSAFCSR